MTNATITSPAHLAIKDAVGVYSIATGALLRRATKAESARYNQPVAVRKPVVISATEYADFLMTGFSAAAAQPWSN